MDSSDALAHWAAQAGARDERMLWGKARPGTAGPPAHPLLCHLIDVLNVARVILEEGVSVAMRYRLLRALGPDEDAALRSLLFLIGLHDLGKATPAFAAKLPAAIPLLRQRGFDVDPPAQPPAHGTLGVGLIAAAVGAHLGADPQVAWQLGRAVAAHHGTFPADANSDPMPAFGPRHLGRSPAWVQARAALVHAVADAAGLPVTAAVPEELARDHAFFVALAGLTSVADWVGSMDEQFTYAAPPASPSEYAAVALTQAHAALRRIGMVRPRRRAPRPFEDLFHLSPWPLHVAAAAVAGDLTRPALIVIEAPMGEGKTEAALHLADHLAATLGLGGLFVGLPTQATANQMVRRVGHFLAATRPDETSQLELVHGEAAGPALAGIYDGSGPVVAEAWFAARKRALLASQAVGTVDQALLGVLRVRHGFVRLFGLGGKVVVLDEVHAYDAYTSTLLDRLVGWLAGLGTTVVILSATLPSARRRQLLEAWAPHVAAAADTPYPRITVASGEACRAVAVPSRRRPLSVTLERRADDRESVARELAAWIAGGGCAGWICNTVQRAQDAYQTLAALRQERVLPADVRLLLLHARFPAEDRELRERLLDDWLGRHGTRPERCVVVGTQVLEQSLDVDFDLLATDLAPIDLVLQRAGRLHRHDERGARPAAVAEPRLLLIAPAEPPVEAPLRDVAGVYEPYVVRRTLLALAGRARLTLPAEIEPLVEAVYTAPDPPEAAAPLARERADWDARTHDERQDAGRRLLPVARCTDDPFAALDMPFDDDDPEAHRALQALTRLGPPAIEVVCLFEVGGRLCYDPAGAEPASLRPPLAPETVLRLVRRSIGIARRDLYRALHALDPPSVFAASALLRRRRLLVFRERRAAVGHFHLHLHPDLGLVLETAPGEAHADL